MEHSRHWLWKLRLRYSLRTLLGLVTLASIGCWMWVRSLEFERRAEKYHTGTYVPLLCSSVIDLDGSVNFETLHYYDITHKWAEYCELMELKYRRASKYPWLPVEPDPPEPERPFYATSLLGE
jgi:hypothetical protein